MFQAKIQRNFFKWKRYLLIYAFFVLWHSSSIDFMFVKSAKNILEWSAVIKLDYKCDIFKLHAVSRF